MPGTASMTAFSSEDAFAWIEGVGSPGVPLREYQESLTSRGHGTLWSSEKVYGGGSVADASHAASFAVIMTATAPHKNLMIGVSDASVLPRRLL